MVDCKVFNDFKNSPKPDAKYCGQVITNALMYAMASIKHPGFVDEDEWRLIYLHNTDS